MGQLELASPKPPLIKCADGRNPLRVSGGGVTGGMCNGRVLSARASPSAHPERGRARRALRGRGVVPGRAQPARALAPSPVKKPSIAVFTAAGSSTVDEWPARGTRTSWRATDSRLAAAPPWEGVSPRPPRRPRRGWGFLGDLRELVGHALALDDRPDRQVD